MALITLDEVKKHLGITDTAQDAALTMWMNAAIGAVKEACRGYLFEETTCTEYYSPDGYTLILRHLPVQSITTIHEDSNGQFGQSADPFPASTLLSATTDYMLVEDGNRINGEVSKSGLVKRLGKMWPRRNTPTAYRSTNYQRLIRALIPNEGSVKVVYVSGSDSVPDDVVQAIAFEVDAMRMMRKRGGMLLSGESLGEYSYSLATVDKASKGAFFLSPATATLLAPYLIQRHMVL